MKSPIAGLSASEAGQRGVWWRGSAFGAGSSIATVLALPPFCMVWAAFLAPFVLAVGIGHLRHRPNQAAVWMGVGTIPAWLYLHRWLQDVALIGWPLLALLMAAHIALTARLVMGWINDCLVRSRMWRVASMALALPTVWVGVEYFRGELLLTGYPWYFAAHPLIDVPLAAAPARFVGILGVSWLLVALAGVLALGTKKEFRSGHSHVIGACWPAGAMALALGALWLGLSIGSGDVSAERIRVGIVQTNVPQSNKMGWSIVDREKLFSEWLMQTREAVAAGAQVVLWPETMFPGPALNADAVQADRAAGMYFRIPPSPGAPADAPARRIEFTAFADQLLKEQRAAGVPFIIGGIAEDGVRISTREDGSVDRTADSTYNSAFLVVDGRDAQRYDKIDLTPFGEVIPIVWRWPAVEEWVVSLGAAGMTFDLDFGASRSPLRFEADVGGGRRIEVAAAAPICFEATKSSLVRSLVYSESRRVANLIVNLSNDGWFGGTSGVREQHLLTARWRSIEFGVPMVRAVNTGLSCAVDANGRLVAPTNQPAGGCDRTGGVIIVDVPLANDGGGTLFGRLGGDWFGRVALGATVLVAIMNTVRKRRSVSEV